MQQKKNEELIEILINWLSKPADKPGHKSVSP
jgi:hypothetical protein